jgi:hypothetical protein
MSYLFAQRMGMKLLHQKTPDGSMVYRQMVGSDHVKLNYGDLVRRSDIVEIWIDEEAKTAILGFNDYQSIADEGEPRV